MFENIKDPYHATLLHVFLVTFGLFRADNPSKVQMDEGFGLHSVLVSQRGERKADEATADIRQNQATFTLANPLMLQPVKEFAGDATVVMQTLWPNLIVQQQTNTLAMRQLVPRAPAEFELAWTFFGYAGDDEAMVQRRLRQANLMGPSGYVSIDDSEMMALAQAGIAPAPEQAAVVELGGRGWEEEIQHGVSENLIRGLYDYYRQVMEL